MPRYDQGGRRYHRTDEEGIEDLLLRGDVQPLLPLERDPDGEIEELLIANTTQHSVGVIKERVAKLEQAARRTGPKEVVQEADYIVYLVTEALAADEVKDEAAELSIRVRRAVGGVLARILKHGGDRRSPRSRSGTATLNDLGITKTNSSRWQALYRFPDAEFELTLKTIRTEKPGTLGITRVVRMARAWLREHGEQAGRRQEQTPRAKALLRLLKQVIEGDWFELSDDESELSDILAGLVEFAEMARYELTKSPSEDVVQEAPEHDEGDS